MAGQLVGPEQLRCLVKLATVRQQIAFNSIWRNNQALPKDKQGKRQGLSAEFKALSGCFDGSSNPDTVSDDLATAPGCPRPQKHSLRLGRGRRHLPDCLDHCRHRRRTRRLYHPAAKRIWLDNRGDLLGPVDPLHSVRIDDVAARIASLAAASEILVSRTVKDYFTRSLSE